MGTRVAEMRADELCPGREKTNHVLMAWLHAPQIRSHRKPRQTHGQDTHSPQTQGLTDGARGCYAETTVSIPEVTEALCSVPRSPSPARA